MSERETLEGLLWNARLHVLRAAETGLPPSATHRRLLAMAEELEFIAGAFKQPKGDPREVEQLELDDSCEARR